MKETIEKLLSEVAAFTPSTKEELEAFRIDFLANKGKIKALFADFKNVPNEQKKDVGQLINTLKEKAQSKVDDFKAKLSSSVETSEESIDLTRTATPSKIGSRHPISIVRNEIINIFSRIGFTVSEGPEVEDDWHNFTALNFPPEHPARDMQDTFFVESEEGEMALRTHTSSVQVRIMENQKPPIRTLSPGRVYRNEAISARAHCFFHQVEGLYIAENVSFADLKQTLMYFAKEMFGEKTQIRLRPSYFPFTEPSAEMDVSCSVCDSKGCNVCKYTGFLEIMGCGMVDPNVLENCGIDSKKYTGFAFGMGVERIAMLKYKVNDLRLYSEGDVRFLDQFKSAF
ncbi:MAG: phenylalanine--tRNA ligase subunit alpha [Vicingaceae bacterium]|nr:phenylalanine--tRNA ligase subunit alpha [Vicingaceae bacterium]